MSGGKRLRKKFMPDAKNISPRDIRCCWGCEKIFHMQQKLLRMDLLCVV
jgi:hypothetical protein